jgi:MFS family permease
MGTDTNRRSAMDQAALQGTSRRTGPEGRDPYKGKWLTLSNTTLGVLMATVNSSIILIALPDIFRGVKLNPLTPSNTDLFLWLLMGYMVVTAVLVVSFGRLGDMFGRVRMYNLGFARTLSPRTSAASLSASTRWQRSPAVS